jgi:hypothetical protein
MLGAAAINKTFLSPDLIKWSGFEIMGESLLSVLRAQEYAYYLGNRDPVLERAILETPDYTEQVFILLCLEIDNRNWMQSPMNLNLLRNDLIRNRILEDHNGFQKRLREGDLIFYGCIGRCWFWMGFW